MFAVLLNFIGQLGLNHTMTVREPEKIESLSGKGINQVSTGRVHSAAWTGPFIRRGINLNSGVDLLLGILYIVIIALHIYSIIHCTIF